MDIVSQAENKLFNKIPKELKNNIFYANYYEEASKLLKKMNKSSKKDIFTEDSKKYKIYLDYKETEVYGISYIYSIYYEKNNDSCSFNYYIGLEEDEWIKTANIRFSDDKEKILVLNQSFTDLVSNPKVKGTKSVFDKEGNEIQRIETSEDVKTKEIYWKKELYAVKGYSNLFLYSYSSNGITIYKLFIKDNELTDLNSRSFENVLKNNYFENNLCQEELTEKEFFNILHGYYSEEDLCRLFDRESELVRRLSTTRV